MHDVILELERGFWRAAGDPEFYEAHFADDGVMAFHVGVMDKRAVVESMRGAGEWESFSITEPQFIDIAADVVSLTYVASARAEGGSSDYRAVVTSVYANRDGGWLLVVHQQTPLA